jgi:pimeloyl-ACP methyl ester carboxylesterase
MAGWRFPYRGEVERIDDQVRASVDGDFVALDDGFVHYQRAGMQHDLTVVLIHGFSMPYHVWDPTFEALVDAGFDVLRYDLFGRGYSDRPEVSYDIDLYDRQLDQLLLALDVRPPVCLVGLSMGGPIAVTYAARRPNQVQKLVLIDPSGIPMKLPLTYRILLLPGVGELLFGLFGNETLVQSAAKDFFHPREIDWFLERYRIQMRYRGFKRALLSTLRNGMLGDFSSTFQRIGQLGLPTLLIWGMEDNTIPYEHSRRVMAAIPQAEFHLIADAGHVPHYERPEQVNPLLIAFLSRFGEG